MRAGVIRSVGPEMLSAAITSPRAPRTGAAIADRPISSSSIEVANPSRRNRLELAVGLAVAASGSPGRRAAERREHLAVGGVLVADRAPKPLTGAEEVPAIDLGDVLDSVGPGHGQVDRLAAGLRQRVERGPRQLDEVALEHAALGHPEDRRPRVAGARAHRPARSGHAAPGRSPDAMRCSWAARRRWRGRSARPAPRFRARARAGPRRGRRRSSRAQVRLDSIHLELLFHAR